MKFNLLCLYIPLFLISIIVIDERELNNELKNQCYRIVLSLFSLLLLFCLLKILKIKKLTAIGIVILFYIFNIHHRMKN